MTAPVPMEWSLAHPELALVSMRRGLAVRLCSAEEVACLMYSSSYALMVLSWVVKRRLKTIWSIYWGVLVVAPV